jgi:hypothetical protein
MIVAPWPRGEVTAQDEHRLCSVLDQIAAFNLRRPVRLWADGDRIRPNPGKQRRSMVAALLTGARRLSGQAMAGTALNHQSLNPVLTYRFGHLYYQNVCAAVVFRFRSSTMCWPVHRQYY